MYNMMRKIVYILVFLIVTALGGCSASPVFTPLLSGDCVDRAVRIRQELRAKGYEADIVLGIIRKGEKIEGHAWIRYKDKKTGEWKEIKNY